MWVSRCACVCAADAAGTREPGGGHGRSASTRPCRDGPGPTCTYCCPCNLPRFLALTHLLSQHPPLPVLQCPACCCYLYLLLSTPVQLAPLPRFDSRPACCCYWSRCSCADCLCRLLVVSLLLCPCGVSLLLVSLLLVWLLLCPYGVSLPICSLVATCLVALVPTWTDPLCPFGPSPVATCLAALVPIWTDPSFLSPALPSLPPLPLLSPLAPPQQKEEGMSRVGRRVRDVRLGRREGRIRQAEEEGEKGEGLGRREVGRKRREGWEGEKGGLEGR